MISLYSTWWIKPGNEKKVIPALNKLVNNVKKKEPGTIRYRVTIDKEKFSKAYPFYKSEPAQRPGTVVFLESYSSWKALNDHVTGPIFSTFLKNYGKYFVQGPKEKGKSKPFFQVVFLDDINGFVRSQKKNS